MEHLAFFLGGTTSLHFFEVEHLVYTFLRWGKLLYTFLGGAPSLYLQVDKLVYTFWWRLPVYFRVNFLV